MPRNAETAGTAVLAAETGHGSAFRLQPLMHWSRYWPCFSSGRTACGNGHLLRERSAPVNRDSGSRRTASLSVEGNDERINIGSIQRHDIDIPLHPLAASGDVEETVSSLERDFWNHFGMDAGWRSRKPLVIVQVGPLAIPSGTFP
ncbi:MAG: hypothetical protein F4X97_15930 [Boseongicola sp. SB0662_bin_57]|nr:hypothetical protein [Boseongicola sp. SB0662_bin_57]